MELHCVRAGQGRPLLLLHSLGGSWRTWCPVLPALRRSRDVIAVDLPGFGDTPPLAGPTSLTTLADAVTGFLGSNALYGVDVAGISVGAQLTLELRRRGVVGATVALSPTGFYTPSQRFLFRHAMLWSARLARRLPGAMPAVCESRLLKTLLFAQFSVRPWSLPGHALLDEMRDLDRARRFYGLLGSLEGESEAETLQGVAKRSPLTIGWAAKDRICLPSQAERAMTLYPEARLQWIPDCGHFPQWDQPEATVSLILSGTEPDRSTDQDRMSRTEL